MNWIEKRFGWDFWTISLVFANICTAQDPQQVRAARSVHLSYPATEALLFYNEVTVQNSVNGSYFMACGWNTGYFGIQQLDGPEDKVVLFSVWDPTKGDDPNAIKEEDRVEVLSPAEDVRIKRFGGEGTGAQCMWKFAWHIGETNRFLIGARVEGQKTAYTAWFKTEGAWKKLASFRIRSSGKPLSGYYSFIEDFRRDGKSARETRRARFGNGWVQTADGQWTALSQARFTASGAEWESKENIDAGIRDGGFYLATGGDIKMSRQLRSIIDLPNIPQIPRGLQESLPSDAANNLTFIGLASVAPDSDPAHRAKGVETPQPWPDGIIPYDIGALASEQQTLVRRAMQRWMDTGARIAFVPRSTQEEYVSFTGRTDAGNNTSRTGFKPGSHADINITAFWWRQGEWMPAHELGHALGLHHEHARWDRDAYVTIHYENIKPGREADYDWIPKTNWLVSSTPYDYYSIMHYRVCWASSCESQCRDGDGSSPCAVIDPVGTNDDRIIGQWDRNGISLGDSEKLRLAYGTGKTFYVQTDRPHDGTGTIENPYRDLEWPRRHCPPNARILLISGPGSWSIAAPDHEAH